MNTFSLIPQVDDSHRLYDATYVAHIDFVGSRDNRHDASYVAHDASYVVGDNNNDDDNDGDNGDAQFLQVVDVNYLTFVHLPSHCSR
ncbi:hypothetical protein [Oceanobacillus chungangensis]|uniref:Uncharacterized protein n=1 Tax=Oceanobacillus chungangensis TaxID=1229152 RepID=A0A3D8PVA8_9BACI|nr:hypothetical protein [Oceanobacillus chungangensis]RDW19662.1 hypothetical protein CWR45_06165 [Oceanobacillus chungangensis]